jgi:hypothetical protein
MAEAALPEKRREIQIKKQREQMSKGVYFWKSGRKRIVERASHPWETI